MPPKKAHVGRLAKGGDGVKAKPNGHGGSSKAKRPRSSPAAGAKPSPSMPPPPPRKKPSKSAEESDEWTMPSLSEDPLKARRKLEKMLREIELLLAQNGVQQQGSTRVLSHEERKKVAHKSSIEDMLRRIMAADTESGCATPTGEGAQPAPDVSMGSGSSHRTRASKQASPLSVASSSSSPAPPNLCQSASGALAAYKSLITDPQERHQPPVTRNAEAAAQAGLEERIANLIPRR